MCPFGGGGGGGVKGKLKGAHPLDKIHFVLLSKEELNEFLPPKSHSHEVLGLSGTVPSYLQGGILRNQGFVGATWISQPSTSPTSKPFRVPSGFFCGLPCASRDTPCFLVGNPVAFAGKPASMSLLVGKHVTCLLIVVECEIQPVNCLKTKLLLPFQSQPRDSVPSRF